MFTYRIEIELIKIGVVVYKIIAILYKIRCCSYRICKIVVIDIKLKLISYNKIYKIGKNCVYRVYKINKIGV